MTKTKRKKTPVPEKTRVAELPSSGRSFYVVGIGASAGGLEALERFFEHTPENTGIAFVVVSHLDPTHVSIMPELLQKSTRMTISQAEDGMPVEPNHVYVAPANRDLAMLHGTFQLLEPVEPHGFRLPIDFFFKSLSEDVRDKAICVILSGMASDGTAGLRAIKSELGMAMAQDPRSAKFDGMPGNAIRTQLVDYVLPPEEMSAQLIKYVSRHAASGLLRVADAEGKVPDAIQKLFILLRNRTGHDFSLYKKNTIYRRVERRLNIAQLNSLSSYVRMIQENPAELEHLFKEILIGVTSFFRDPEAFVKVKSILLKMVERKPDNGQIRIWVVGCSTGEEAYSLAMILRECMEETKADLNVQIFATDIDGAAIEKARLGQFSGIGPDVGKERLNRFFILRDNIYHVRKEIREMVVFAQQSVIKDPPFTKLDMISCRNLLIYFSAELQNKLIPIFHYSLHPDGLLFLGSSETVSAFVDLFSIADNKGKIYRRRGSAYSTQPLIDFPASRPIRYHQETSITKTERTNLAQQAEAAILKSYSPNCVVVSGTGDVVYIHGKTGKYLELSHGEARLNIFEMAREGLKEELSALMRKALSARKSFTVAEIRIKSEGRTSVVNLTVKPIKEPAEMAGFVLIIFEDVVPDRSAPPSKRIHHDKSSQRFIKDLEHELKTVRANLRSAVEELETSNEELKSSNEEMQSTNEEMQSSNEELETSKEELQSLNEELITVNTEMQSKNDQLSVVNNDIKNLMDSTDIPTIFLDNQLCIKRFTAHAKNVVNLLASDVGRPISHLAAKFKYDTLVDDAEEVLRTLAQRNAEIQTNDGLWYQMRILPYRTTSNVIDGVVITFSDINKLKRTYEEIKKLSEDIQRAREYAENIIDTVREALLILDERLIVVSANRSFHKMFEGAGDNTVGKSVFTLENGKWDIPPLRQLLEQIIPQQNKFEDYRIDYNAGNGKQKTLLLNARQMFHGEENSKLILLAIQLHTTT